MDKMHTDTTTDFSNLKYGDMHAFPNSPDLPVHVPLIGINHCHDNYRNIRPKSPITVLGYVIKGQGKIQVNSEKYRLQHGDAFILKKDSRHEVTALPSPEGEWTYYWYNIRGNSLPLLETFHLEHTAHIPQADIESLFVKGFELAAQNFHRDSVQTRLLLICSEIIMTLYHKLEERNSLFPLKMRNIKLYLERFVREPFNSEQLSRHMALSFKQLNRIFKQSTGSTIYQHILMRKIDTAKMMLQDTDMTVGEIAGHLGYNDQHYFSNLFKQKTGASPTAYRTKQRRETPAKGSGDADG